MNLFPFIVFFATALAAFGGTASAGLLAYRFSGSIGFDGNGFTSGDTVAGRLVYDTGIVDASPDPNFGQYGNAAIKSLSLTVGGNDLTGKALGGSNYIVNRFGDDRVTFRTMSIAFDAGVSDCNDIATCLFSLIFIDPTDSILSDDGAPSVDDLAPFGVKFGEINVAGVTVNFGIDEITRVQTVPEPESAIIFVTGLLAFGAARWYERKLSSG